MNEIIDVMHRGKRITAVRKENGLIDVCTNDKVTHPNCDNDSALRALAFYLEDGSTEATALCKCGRSIPLDVRDRFIPHRVGHTGGGEYCEQSLKYRKDIDG